MRGPGRYDSAGRSITRLSLSLSLSRKDREFAFTDGYVDDGVPRKRDELKTHQARRCLMASAEVNAR